MGSTTVLLELVAESPLRYELDPVLGERYHDNESENVPSYRNVLHTIHHLVPRDTKIFPKHGFSPS